MLLLCIDLVMMIQNNPIMPVAAESHLPCLVIFASWKHSLEKTLIKSVDQISTFISPSNNRNVITKVP